MTLMSNTNKNGTNKNAPKSRKGPRPIMTVAMLREKMLKELMVKELRKIDRKMTKLLRSEKILEAKLSGTRIAMDNLRIMRVEYSTEMKD